MSPRIKRFIHQRNRLYHSDPILYRAVRNRFIREIVSQERYYSDKGHHFKQAKSSKLFYKVKSLCRLQKHSPSFPYTSHLPPKAVADEINPHFDVYLLTFRL